MMGRQKKVWSAAVRQAISHLGFDSIYKRLANASPFIQTVCPHP